MADTTEIKWIYPTNWDGFIEDNMGFRKMIVRLTGISDGTGETDAIKVTKADLMTTNRKVPSLIAIDKIEYAIHGLTAVLEWDYSPDQVIARMNSGVAAGNSENSLTFTGGLIPEEDLPGTGNITLTTTNCNSGDTYDITLHIRLKD